MLATVMPDSCLFTFRPHPGERGTRVSKDGPRVPLPPSFETLASQAPQDEVRIPGPSTSWFARRCEASSEDGAARLLTMSKKLRPHPEERRRRVSKDGHES